VELVGGGFYEPIPGLDSARRSARTDHSPAAYLEKHFAGFRPAPGLPSAFGNRSFPPALAAANVAYTLSMTYISFPRLRTGRTLWAYIAETDGRTVWALPRAESLRYLIPFGKVGDVIAYLRDAASVTPARGRHGR